MHAQARKAAAVLSVQVEALHAQRAAAAEEQAAAAALYTHYVRTMYALCTRSVVE